MRVRRWSLWDSWNSPERLHGWGWQIRRLSRVPAWNLSVILIVTFVTFGLMARTAEIGGEIRHAEVRAAQETTTSEGALARNVGSFVTETLWVWPTFETLHFVGLTLLLGVVLLVDLRVVGVVRASRMRPCIVCCREPRSASG